MIKGNHYRIRSLTLVLLMTATLGILASGCFFTEEMDDGAGVRQIHYPEPPLENWLLSVWGTSETDVWAVGQPGIILHYDGSTWTMDTVDTDILSAVWGTSPTNVFACGSDGDIYRYNGSKWSKMESGTTEHLTAIGEGPYGEIFAVGEHAAIRQLSGSEWVGTQRFAYRFTSLGEPSDTLDFHFDLDGFSVVAPFCIAGDSARIIMENLNEDSPFTWMWSTAEDRQYGYIRCSYGDADTISNNYLGNSLGEVLRLGRDNAGNLSWLYPKDPNAYRCRPATWPAPLTGIWMHPDEETLYVSTQWGTIGTLQNDCSDTDLVYDGDQWLSDIWGNTDGSEIFAVGLKGLILHSTGGAFIPMENVPLPE